MLSHNNVVLIVVYYNDNFRYIVHRYHRVASAVEEYDSDIFCYLYIHFDLCDLRMLICFEMSVFWDVFNSLKYR